MEPKHLRFLIPPTSENRWTDLLATFIDIDPAPMSALLGGANIDGVHREVVASKRLPQRKGVKLRRADRLDLVLAYEGQTVAAIEVKLLAPLGRDQLKRYEESFEAMNRYVLHLGAFPMVADELRGWKPLTWEKVLDQYTRSDDPWVKGTAKLWRESLDGLIPRVDAATVWNEVPADVTGFEVALRARMAWLHQELSRKGLTLKHDLVVSSSGGSWILRVWLDPLGKKKNLYLTAELAERLPAVAWKRDESRDFKERMQGPLFLVGIRQEGPKTSASFPWDALRKMFTGPVFDLMVDAAGEQQVNVTDGRIWSKNAASPRHETDRVNHRLMQDAGGPAWLGQGYGMAQAKAGGACVFGARFRMERDVNLGNVFEELLRTIDLLREMAEASGLNDE